MGGLGHGKAVEELARPGGPRRGEVRRGTAWRSRHGKARPGAACPVMAGRGLAVTECHGGSSKGRARPGAATCGLGGRGLGWLGGVRRGVRWACQGGAWRSRQARRVQSWGGLARHGGRGLACDCPVRRGGAWLAIGRKSSIRKRELMGGLGHGKAVGAAYGEACRGRSRPGGRGIVVRGVSRLGEAWAGGAGRSRFGLARLGVVRLVLGNGLARRSRFGLAGRGPAWRGRSRQASARLGLAVEDWRAQGAAGHGAGWHGTAGLGGRGRHWRRWRHGGARPVTAWPGPARRSRTGMSMLGWIWLGEAWRSRRATPGLGKARDGVAVQVRLVKAAPDWARSGSAGRSRSLGDGILLAGAVALFGSY
jgi:hypothetical protein